MIVQTISSYVAPQDFIRALSPKEQTAKEIAAIETDSRLQEKIGVSEYEILKTDRGYSVVTNWCTVQIDVNYIPPEVPICGPAPFELVFHDAIEKFPIIADE